jgi:epoxyqueuosine reductase
MIKECESCDRCLRGCPTGAIREDRFLLDVDRCITYWNEQPPEEDFPKWLQPSWHNCLIGCMICQRVCPANKHFLDWIETGVAFSEDETDILLQGTPFDNVPQSLKDKLEKSDLAGIIELFPRNLGALLYTV